MAKGSSQGASSQSCASCPKPKYPYPHGNPIDGSWCCSEPLYEHQCKSGKQCCLTPGSQKKKPYEPLPPRQGQNCSDTPVGECWTGCPYGGTCAGGKGAQGSCNECGCNEHNTSCKGQGGPKNDGCEGIARCGTNPTNRTACTDALGIFSRYMNQNIAIFGLNRYGLGVCPSCSKVGGPGQEMTIQSCTIRLSTDETDWNCVCTE